MFECTEIDCPYATSSYDKLQSHQADKHTPKPEAKTREFIGDEVALADAIHKMVKNGWKPTQFQVQDMPYIDKTWRNILLTPEAAEALWRDAPAVTIYYILPITAKPPKPDEVNLESGSSYMEGWQYHLQQLVISPTPFKYLKENI